MRNSLRSASSRTGHRRTPIAPLVSRSPLASNMTCQASTDRQEGALGASGQVPEHNSLIRTHGQQPVVVPYRGTLITHRLAGDMDECLVLEGGIDLVRGQSVLRRDDDLSIPAEHGPRGIGAGQAEHRAAQDRVPEPQAAVPAGAGQELTRRVERRVQSAVGRALEPCPENAGRDIPKVDLEIVARRRQRGAVRAPGDRPRGARSGIVRTMRPDSTSRIRHVGCFASPLVTAIWRPSARNARSRTSPRPDRSRRGRPVSRS